MRFLNIHQFRESPFSKNSSKISELEEIFNNFSDDDVKDVFIFDYYENKKTLSTKIGFRIIFQSHTKTLTDIEVDNVMKGIINTSLKIEDVEIPGLKDNVTYQKKYSKKISNELNKPTSESLFLINSFINLIKSNSKNKVKINKFGTFEYKKTPERLGRDPKNPKKEYKIKSFKRFVFKSAFELKKIIN